MSSSSGSGGGGRSGGGGWGRWADGLLPTPLLLLNRLCGGSRGFLTNLIPITTGVIIIVVVVSPPRVEIFPLPYPHFPTPHS